MRLSDVTIREGGQMPGRTYTTAEKIEAGRALDRLEVDFIQPGFAVTGERDREAIETLAAECDATIVSIARALPGDVDAALEADADVIEVFAPLEDRQLEHTIGTSRAETLEAMRAAVDRVHDGGVTAHLTLVDAFRTDLEHVRQAFETFDDVEYVTLADTVGASTPAGVHDFLSALGESVALERAGVHFHDDLGVATANALVANDIGVGKADVSVASLGERAGNAALEEVVAAGVLEREDSFGVDHSILVPVCRSVLETLSEEIDPRKALLGPEVYEHESGIHTAAMLEEPSVMEPFDPAAFGASRRLIFGEKTGAGGARRLLELAGREPNEDLISQLLERLEVEGPMDREAALEVARAL